MNVMPGRRRLPRIRVLFDATYAHRLDGTGRYTREMLRCLRSDPDLVVLALHAPRVRRFPRPLRAATNGILHLFFNQVWLPVVALVRRAHVVHTMAIAPWFCRPPVIVTIHDALDFYPQFRPSRLWSAYVRTFGRIGARRADAIVTVSEFSAQEIARYYRVPRAKLHVIPNAFSLHGIEPSAVSPTGTNPYILFVGDGSTRKNLTTAIAAIEIVRQQFAGLQLVVTGRVGHESIDGRPWIVVLAGINDSELAWLYQNAVAVIVPSRYEGFSLPVLEALAFGVPVVASDIPAHREVAGDSIELVPPDDARGFATRLEAILLEHDGMKSRPARPPQSGWEQSEARLVDIYLGLIKIRLGVAA